MFSYPEQKEELVYDAEKAIENVKEWKSHIVRAINQEKAKRYILDHLAENQVLVIMDWAMKWLPRKYRETQIEWFGKKGLSWHVSACIIKAHSDENDFEVSRRNAQLRCIRISGGLLCIFIITLFCKL